MRSVQPAAFQYAGIVRTRAGGRRHSLGLSGRGHGLWQRGLRLGGWRREPRRRSGRFLKARLNCRGRLLRDRRICRILAGLPMCNEFGVTRCTRTRRGIVRQSAGPMRPMIRDIARELAAASETQC